MTKPCRFRLEAYTTAKSRYTCPKCQHRSKTFTRYMDNQTGQHVADHVGKCDREEKCGYFYKPSEYFKAYPQGYTPTNDTLLKQQFKERHFDTLPFNLVTNSMRGYHRNNFMRYLTNKIGAEKATDQAMKYHIGTAKHWPGATVFWQVDVNGKVRTGKVMLYNADDCKRVKNPYNHIAWAHKLGQSKVGSLKSEVGALDQGTTQDSQLKTQNFSLKQCLFGEHLLSLYPHNPVAIVESEKTAIVCSHYYPQYTWLATGGVENLSVEKCQVLAHKSVRIFPDLSAYAKWHMKARELNARIPSAIFRVDETLLLSTPPRLHETGLDLADVLLGAY